MKKREMRGRRAGMRGVSKSMTTNKQSVGKCEYHRPCGCEAQEKGIEHLCCVHIGCIYPLALKEGQDEWERKFDKEFPYLTKPMFNDYTDATVTCGEEVKQFISLEIAKSRKEVAEEIKKKVRKIKKKSDLFSYGWVDLQVDLDELSLGLN